MSKRLCQKCLSELPQSRSQKQNRLSHKLYCTISKYDKQHSELEIKAICKYHIGLPIIIDENPKQAAKFEYVFGKMDYETRLKAMEMIPLSSILTVKQMARYLDGIYKHYESQGHVLPRPEDLYYEALGYEMKAA